MLVSINPANGEKIAEYPELTEKEILHKLEIASIAAEYWGSTELIDRKRLMSNFVAILESKKNQYAQLITLEMGKPLKQSIAEIEKCILMSKIYIDEIENLIHEEKVKTDYKESYIEFEPLGPILAIMPWNYPFWQVLRFAVPNLLLGNVCLLKHSSSVQGSAIAIEKLFIEANFPEGVFQNLQISSESVEMVIRNPIAKAVTFTGSENAGSKVAAIAGSEIKKTVLELGGSDPFIVLSDADVVPVCENAVKSRLRNSGQACTSAKRFIVMEDIAEKFIQNYVNYFKSLKVGDPMEDVDVGPLASESALKDIEAQVRKSVEMGARVEVGGHRIDRPGFYFEPTVLTNVKRGMPAYDEEIFGPVSSIIIAKNEEEIIRIANDTKYGLAASIWTKDIDKAKRMARDIQAGSVYINAVVSSDPRMPFGGIKRSGYGRELSKYGLIEFVNIKTMIVG